MRQTLRAIAIKIYRLPIIGYGARIAVSVYRLPLERDRLQREWEQWHVFVNSQLPALMNAMSSMHGTARMVRLEQQSLRDLCSSGFTAEDRERLLVLSNQHVPALLNCLSSLHATVRLLRREQIREIE